MIKMKFHFLLWIALCALPPSSTWAAVTLPSLLSDHAVLQKSDKTALWGKADPDEKVTASMGGASGAATTDADGKWKIVLDLSQAGTGPFDLTVEGKNKLVVHDVVVGEVWVASGQSNMEFPLSRSIGGPEEVAASANPQLREFRVPNNAAATPQDECKGSWTVSGPATSGSYTAVGYYFAKNLQQTLHTPVGLIASYWGGTPLEAWTSAEALDRDPDLKAARERIGKETADYDVQKAAYVATFHDWVAKYERADKPADPAAFAAPNISTSDWKPVTLPGKFSAAGLPDAGAVWIRKTIPLHGAASGGLYPLDLSAPEGFETIYYNGKQVAAVTPETFNGKGGARRSYPPGGKEGDNVIAIRLYNPLGNGGIGGDPKHFTFGTTPLQGEWLAKAEYELPTLADDAVQNYPQPPKSVLGPSGRPCTLYNGMIQPLLPYTIRGAIWYQGENNAGAGHSFQYRTAFPLMIQDWRARWGEGDFPFYFCQLASFMAKKPAPDESAWAELREAQTLTLSLPNTGQAIGIDLGETEDIHLRDKKDVGERLSSIALAKTYGKEMPFSGPAFDSATVEGDKIRLTFREIDGGLVAKPLPAQYVATSLQNKNLPLTRNSPNSELEGFAICGEDRKWVWADAKIDGDTVVVWNTAVPHPVAVRYAWANSPTANLYNQAGLPAGPFRTDSFPGVTDKAKL